jgi:hypothetical protein
MNEERKSHKGNGQWSTVNWQWSMMKMDDVCGEKTHWRASGIMCQAGGSIAWRIVWCGVMSECQQSQEEGKKKDKR